MLMEWVKTREVWDYRLAATFILLSHGLGILSGPHVCTASSVSPQLSLQAQEPRFKGKKKHQYATKTEWRKRGKGGKKETKKGGNKERKMSYS